MHKFNKIAVLVSSLFAMQTFGAEADKFNIELYGKLGATIGESDSLLGQSDRVEDGFSMYEDTKIGLIADYTFNKHFMFKGEIKTDFQGQDIDLRLQELYIRADFLDGFNAELGRLRVPLYMHSEIQDQDFDLKTYRAVRGWSTERSYLETLDGLSFGYEHDFLGMGQLELNALYGISKERDYKVYNFLTDDSDDVTLDTDAIGQVEAIMKTKFGKFRVGYLEASDKEINNIERGDFDSTSMSYSYDSGALFVDAGVAIETDNNEDLEKYQGTLGYQVYGFTPYLTYSSVDYDTSDDLTSIEAGLGYKINRYISVKSAIENLEIGDENEILYSLGFVGKF